MNFSIAVDDGVVVIDGSPAPGVNMAGIPSEVFAVQWQGEKGWVEYRRDLETGVKPSNEEIDTFNPYEAQISQAEEIIEQLQSAQYAVENPKFFYSTVEPLGLPIKVTEAGWPAPPDSTPTAPTEQPSTNTSLYWDGNNFVWSPFPIDADLDAAKAYVKQATNKKAYQILLPSDWMAARQAETGTPVPSNWASWRQEVRDEVQIKAISIESADTLEELHDYALSSEYLTWPTPPSN